MAPEYQKAGINLYFSLWEGPTEAQLAELKKDGMQVVCGQNAAGLAHIDDPTIVGWMHGDEPDNAQSGTGSPVPPAKIVEEYEAIRKADPSRPVFVNFGRGVAWDGWKGRGTRNNHPEDFAEYIKGCDIASFDIYPVANMPANLRGQLDFVGHGVERLVKWCDGGKYAWNALECTRIHGDDKPTPKQVRTEVWMSLVKGSRGIIYFVHQFLPKFDEHALLDDPEMLAAVTAINRQITRLARAEQPHHSGRSQGGIFEQGRAAGDHGEEARRRHVRLCRRHEGRRNGCHLHPRRSRCRRAGQSPRRTPEH